MTTYRPELQRDGRWQVRQVCGDEGRLFLTRFQSEADCAEDCRRLEARDEMIREGAHRAFRA